MPIKIKFLGGVGTVTGSSHLVSTDKSQVLFYDAGHILGSSIIVLDIKDGLQNTKLGYAVDLGRKNLPLLNDPVVPKCLFRACG